MEVKVSAGDAVYGDVGRSTDLDLNNRGCGDWTVGNVAGRARLDVTGSGATRAGSAGAAEVAVAGSGDVVMREVRGPLNVGSSGSGGISVANLRGPLTVRIAGSGDVKVDAGEASEVNVSIAGSGGVRFGGVARSLKASIAGSGDVSVAQVQARSSSMCSDPARFGSGAEPPRGRSLTSGAVFAYQARSFRGPSPWRAARSHRLSAEAPYGFGAACRFDRTASPAANREPNLSFFLKSVP